MRIDLNTNAAVSGAHLEKTQSSRGGQASSTQKQPASSESDISVGKLAAAVLSAPEVRSEKVQALQSQIQSGTYHVSSSQVSASMLEQMRVRSA